MVGTILGDAFIINTISANYSYFEMHHLQDE